MFIYCTLLLSTNQCVNGQVKCYVLFYCLYLNSVGGNDCAGLLFYSHTPATTSSEDIKQLASSASLQSAPPFLKLLVSSLQSYTAKRPDSTPSLSQNSTVPPELSQMMTAFKQLRPIQNHTNGTSESDEATASKEEQSRVEVNEDVVALVECKVSEMEKRILEYIDSKFVTLQCQMDTMFKTRLSNTHHCSECTDVINDEQLD